MCIVCDDLEGDGIDILALLVLCKVQLDQLSAFERLSVDGVGSMLLQPGKNVGEVEDGAIGGADGVLEGL